MSVILQAPVPQLETATILPNPEFSDVEAHQHSVIVKRSMNNTKRTYVRSSNRFLLTYTFRLTRGKALEFEAFVRCYYGSKIKMTNHKDEVWLVNFATNPFDFVGDSRAAGVPGNETMTVTVGLEGEQL